MASFSLFLLGGFQVERDGAVIAAFESNKVRGAAGLSGRGKRARPHPRGKFGGAALARSPRRDGAHQPAPCAAPVAPDARPTPPHHPLLLTTHQTIELNPNLDLNVDVSRFTALLAACERHPHPALTSAVQTCSNATSQAAELYRGDFLAGLSLLRQRTL